MIAEAGFGGAELQAFNAALDPGASPDELVRRLGVDSDSYFAHLGDALTAARASGLKMDLTVGSGWPTGGTHVPPEESMQTLMFSELEMSGPGSATRSLSGPDMPAFYHVADMARSLGEPLVRYLPEEATLVAVLAAQVVLDQRDTNPLKVTDTVYLDRATVTDLTLAAKGGVLSWDVPEGTWRVVAFWQLPDGEYPNLAALPEPGFVMNHFDEDAVLFNIEHLLGDRTKLEEFFGDPLRAVFVDSFELKVERYFAGDFMAEFEARRGYALTEYLPVVMVPGADNHVFDGGGIPTEAAFAYGDQDSRVRHDYALTASELFKERFASTLADWALERDIVLRMQGYGFNLDVLGISSVAGIPEAEQLFAGGTDLVVKFASSAAHISGRALASAEAFVWGERAYMSTPTKLKAAADKLFSAGINHLVYHGFPYRKLEGYGEAGWHPFCSPYSGVGTYSSNLGEEGPFWAFTKQFNQYVSRVQYLLRQGRPEVDLLVYYPFLKVPASLGRMKQHDELLFNGRFGQMEPGGGTGGLFALLESVFGQPDLGPEGLWLEGVWPLVRKLAARGYGIDYVGASTLGSSQVEDGRIALGSGRYRAIVIIDAPYMEIQALAQVVQLAKDGAFVLVAGQPPRTQPGFAQWQKRDEETSALMDELLATGGDWVPDVGGIPDKLLEIGIKPAVGLAGSAAPGLFVRRLTDDGLLAFLANQTNNDMAVQAIVDGGCPNATWLDPWTGTAVTAADGLTSTSLAEFGSIVLACGLTGVPQEMLTAHPSWVPADALSELAVAGDWHLSVAGDDVEAGVFDQPLAGFPDWRDVEALEFCSSPGTYSGVVVMDEVPEEGPVYLDLGWLYGAATVAVNGTAAGAAVVPPFRVDVTSLLQPGENSIEIDYVPTLRNRLVGLGLAGDAEHAQFAKAGDTFIPTGLMGPVRVLGH